MDKKACVVSSYAYIDKNINYGSLFQYYALEKYLSKNQINAYWLRFCLPEYYTIKYKLKNIIKRILYFGKYNEINKCLKSFDDFINSYLNVSDDVYYSERELTEKLPVADIYISGSDQVWGGILKPNYLTFVPNEKLKISYAASFGKSQISVEQKNTIKPWLERFDKISVREDSGVDICKSMGIEAVQVLDPTLLIDAKDYPIINLKDYPEVYCYFLNFKELDELYWNQVNDWISKNNYKIKIACTEQTFNKIPYKFRDLPTPEEWLSKYYNSKFILTNTFHGTVFAIIFHKPFIVFKQNGNTAKQNSRLESLLKMLNLEDRIFDDNQVFSKQINREINWKYVDYIISKKLEITQSFFDEIE
ncbi:MAG: polysaccharide pyruvyl transferase family protein [Clostridia bacterium]|nr:polysaccharide pyruvyl transferase family protein [Clostridia bacterium]